VWADRSLSAELLRRFGIALYTGLVALLLGPVLLWTAPFWSFRASAQRPPVWR